MDDVFVTHDCCLPAKAKILMLHGHAESGPFFQAKTRRLEKYLHTAFPAAPHPNHHPLYPGGVELHYPTGPLRLSPADVTRGCGPAPSARPDSLRRFAEKQELDARAWGRGDFRVPVDIAGLDQSLTFLLEYIHTQGPFVGVVGFSCGATVGAILASLLENHRKVKGFQYPENFNHQPLSFALCYSGFMLMSTTYKPCYFPKIATPVMHVIGSLDPMIEEEQSLLLARRCKNSRVVYHPGSHYVPTKSGFLDVVVGFVQDVLDVGGVSDEGEWEDI